MESGVCKHCNKSFLFYKSRKSAIFCSKKCMYKGREKSAHEKLCPSCGEIFLCAGLKSKRKFCSNECVGVSNVGRKMSETSKIKKKDTYMNKYGVDNPAKLDEFKDKAKETCLNKYGETSATRHESVKNKIKTTCLERYGNTCALGAGIVRDKVVKSLISNHGVNSPMRSTTIKGKFKNTCLSRYGVENPSSTHEVRCEVKNTCLERYGVGSYLQTDMFKDKIKSKYNGRWPTQRNMPDHIYGLIDDPKEVVEMNRDGLSLVSIAEKIGCSPLWLSRLFAKHNIDVLSYAKSNLEIGVSHLLDELGIQYRANDRHLRDTKGKKVELDIFCEERMVAIEMNGLYWHSDSHVPNNYHLNKTETCLRNGIKLLHFWDSEWDHKREICKSIIKNSLGVTSDRVFARKCEIRNVSYNDSLIFLDNNHLQGAATASVRLGLYHGGELVSLMTFSKPRFSKDISWELVRFANKINTSVLGAASKLLSCFRKRYSGDILSYADRRISTGNLYEKLGFSLAGTSRPSYYYTKGYSVLHNRIKFQKHKLHKLLDNFDPNLSEAENMRNNGYHRVYDCGNLVYKLKGN